MQHAAFELLREQAVAEVSGVARLWRHKGTGAQVLSICNADENKCFGVSFRTPPTDSTGVAHILEHSVLCGSDKYPVREPFVELLKGSLQTFLNAFTFPDKTCYPVASTNEQDFYNLVDVYLDAVFHPRISEDIFRQEGWHVEAPADSQGVDDASNPWTYKGVVYNEMKGVYSSPDAILGEQSQQAVFPDTLYSLDSGGNPEAIPDLSHAAFLQFHASYYHPGNARFFFWGDDPEQRRLDRIAAELAPYAARPEAAEASQVPLQPRRDTPRHIELPYAAQAGEERALFTINWLLCETADVQTALALRMLEHILEGLPGSPLRKALIESGLGEDTTGCGVESDLRQMYYSTGLKGVEPERVQEAELLIFETLGRLAEEGMDPQAVEAAVNSVEFALRENNSGRFPRGLAAMLRSLSTWLYDGDPLAPLCWEAPLAAIKERLGKGEKLFEGLVREYFLDNPHRATVVLLPDTGLAERRAAAEKARLAAVYDAASPKDRAALVAQTAHLRAAQATPDSPEALATIPGLTLADLPPRNTPLPLSCGSAGAMPCMTHELDTSGIAYCNLLLPLDGVPERLLPLVPLFARALTEVGTRDCDFVRLGTRMAAKTGGIWACSKLAARHGSRAPLAWLVLGGKAVRDKVDDLFALLQECLLTPALCESSAAPVVCERLGQMLLESKARLEHFLLAAGHVTAGTRLKARYTVSDWLAEEFGGISSLRHVRTLLDRLQREPEALLADMRELWGMVVQGRHALFDATADATLLGRVQPLAAALGRALPRGEDTPPAVWHPARYAPAEVFTAPAQVNYVGKAADVYALGYRYHGSAHVIMRHLRMGYLWERVRVQGGAYGAFCALERHTGVLVHTSYRDPAVTGTLAAYDGAADFLRGFDPDARELTRAIVGAVGDLDAYMLPDAKGATALDRHLVGDSEEIRQQMREEMLGTTGRHFREFAEVLREAARVGEVCVVGGEAAASAAREHGWACEQLVQEG